MPSNGLYLMSFYYRDGLSKILLLIKDVTRAVLGIRDLGLLCTK